MYDLINGRCFSFSGLSAINWCYSIAYPAGCEQNFYKIPYLIQAQTQKYGQGLTDNPGIK